MRSRASRFADSGIATALALLLTLYAGLAFGFYWLMQPTVVKNHGLAAYQPPPMTVVLLISVNGLRSVTWLTE